MAAFIALGSLKVDAAVVADSEVHAVLPCGASELLLPQEYMSRSSIVNA
jgi:hypothetical protein